LTGGQGIEGEGVAGLHGQALDRREDETDPGAVRARVLTEPGIDLAGIGEDVGVEVFLAA
jgi:hypothetical protein